MNTYKKSVFLSCLFHLTAIALAGYCYPAQPVLPQWPEIIEISLVAANEQETAAVSTALQTAAGTLPADNSTALPVSTAASGSFDQAALSRGVSSQFSPVSGDLSNLPVSPAANPPGGTVSTGSPVVENTITAKQDAGTQAPSVLTKIEPVYPWQARRSRQQGSVIVQATILESGMPADIGVLVSSGSVLLDQAAITAVRQWTFAPARNSLTGAATVSTTQIPITFAIN